MAKKGQIDPKTGKVMDLTPENVDVEYLKRIQECRPKGRIQMSYGEKLLYLERVDEINYDVYEAEELRKKKKLEEELEQLKLEREKEKQKKKTN